MDRRARRHQATRLEILDAAWTLAHERGLNGWTLRELAAAVGMQAPSLYGYFASKQAIYDAMFAQGYEQLLCEVEPAPASARPRQVLQTIAHGFFGFCVREPARFQLLFLRVVPGFSPSASAYALAERTVALLGEQLERAGLSSEADLDLWTAVMTGLASQQISNDPGGTRWERLLDEAVDRMLAPSGD